MLLTHQFDLADSPQSVRVHASRAWPSHTCERETETFFFFSITKQAGRDFSGSIREGKPHMTTPSPLKMFLISAKPEKSMTKTFRLNDSSATVSVKASDRFLPVSCFRKNLLTSRTYCSVFWTLAW